MLICAVASIRPSVVALSVDLAAAIETTMNPLPTLSAFGASKGLRKRYGEGDTAVEALRDVNMIVAPCGRSRWSGRGPSGSGKSTLPAAWVR